jgi:hypothetical protein
MTLLEAISPTARNLLQKRFVIIRRPMEGQNIAAKNRYRTKVGGWSYDQAQARVYPTREAADALNHNHDEIIEL